MVLARWPAPGRCKRRLAGRLGSARAAAVQARLCRHCLAEARSLRARAPVEVVLAVSGLARRAARRWGHALGADRVLVQGSGGLGLRLRRQVLWARRRGGRRIVLIGSDLPELSAADLQAAFAALEERPLVLGPARDGGYWLLGLGAPARAEVWPFVGIDWGSERVLAQTLAAAARRGVEAHLLAERGDLDRPVDLERWR